MGKYFGLFLAIVFFSIPSAFSQENITITTYYPSPAGAYNELLVANRMAVGDTNGDGVVNGLDLPTDVAGNPLPNSFQTVNSLTDRQAVGDVNGDGAINGGDLGQDAAGNPRNGTLTVANALGIGTINPQGELHVRSTDNTNGHANLILEGENPATGATAGSWDIAALGSTGSNGTGANAGALQFNSTTAAGNTTTPMTISSGAPNDAIFVANNGNVGIGTDNPQGRLDVNAINGNGTFGGLIPPRMTTAQRNSISPLIDGMIIYNTTTGQLEMYKAGSGWSAVGGAGALHSYYVEVFRGQPDKSQNIGVHDFCALANVNFYSWGESRDHCNVTQQSDRTWVLTVGTGGDMPPGHWTQCGCTATCIN